MRSRLPPAVLRDYTRHAMQIVLLSGLGADARLFAPQARALPTLRVLSWIPPAPDESMADYARRLAEASAPPGPLILGGASFGGMLACEMARHVDARALVLIGSCAHPRSIAHLLRPLRRWSRHLPRRAFSPPAIAHGVLGWAFGATPTTASTFFEMLREADPGFTRWACAALADWAGAPPSDVPRRAIHGRADRIIAATRVSAEVIVPGAGHLLSLTHPDEVTRFLESVRAAVTSTRVDSAAVGAVAADPGDALGRADPRPTPPPGARG